MDAFVFATLIGLICNFRQEKGAREALDHQKFVEWLEYHKHEELKNLIVNQAALRTEVDNLLRSDMSLMLKKMEELNRIVVGIASRLDQFSGLAAAVSSPKGELSDQALDILNHFANSGAETLFYADFGRGQWTLDCWGGSGGEMTVNEPRFIKDDLKTLIGLGFLDLEINSDGHWLCQLTRAGTRFLQAARKELKGPPSASLPE